MATKVRRLKENISLNAVTVLNPKLILDVTAQLDQPPAAELADLRISEFAN